MIERVRSWVRTHPRLAGIGVMALALGALAGCALMNKPAIGMIGATTIAVFLQGLVQWLATPSKPSKNRPLTDIGDT